VTSIADFKFLYQMLTPEDMERIRRERTMLIEADLYRAHLQLEDAQSDVERKAVFADIIALRNRLQPHYRALGLTVDSHEEELEDLHGDESRP